MWDGCISPKLVPSLPLNIPNLRKATAGNSKFVWTEILEQEYNVARQIMETQIQLSPYDPEKQLRLLIDGASSVGIGYCLFQYVSDSEPEKGAVIISCNSSVLGESQVGWSPIDAELLSLDFAMKSCHYWLYFCEEVKLYSDCSGLLDMLNKPIDQILNLRHHKI